MAATVQPVNNGREKCGQTCMVYSRVCGYIRPTTAWNVGKKEEYKHRVPFDVGLSSAPGMSGLKEVRVA